MQVITNNQLTADVKRVSIIELFLRGKRSENTRRAYKADLTDFFTTVTGQGVDGEAVNWFLSLERAKAVMLVYGYKSTLIERGLGEATVNRRLAALRSLAKFARKSGYCNWELSDVEGEKVQGYRDVSGPTTEQITLMLNIPDRGTVKGKRDYAILRLLWGNALRRAEIVNCDIKDLDIKAGTLAIRGKGRGSQKETISLKGKTIEALTDWINTRDDVSPHEPLFTSLGGRKRGGRMTGEGIGFTVRTIAKKAGINKRVSPHRIRHSSITAALEATNGNVSMVQKLSRHVKVETVMVYNDRRTDQQGEVTDLLEKIA